ncbi:nucleoporin p58/p45-like isoform X2 [Watersipora subatra]
MTFNFGINTQQQGGGLQLSALTSATNPASTASGSSGFSFGKPLSIATTSAGTAPFSFASGSSAASTVAPPPAYGQKPGVATTNSLSTASTPGSLNFSLTGATTTSSSTATSTSGGFSFGTSGLTTSTSGGLKLGTTTSATAGSTGGLTLGATSSTAPTLLGVQTQNKTSNLALGTTAAPKLGGITFGGATSTGLLSTKQTATTVSSTSSGGLTLGGLGGTSSVPATTSSATKGLGGVDPASSAQNASKTSGAGDGKRVKEEAMPNELVETVTKLKEYVKEQKDIAAKISIVSNQQMGKVREQTDSLKHLLSTVTVGLHRNVVSLDKLKQQTSQELKNVEMAHRTKETPAGLQYENSAPNQYFYELLEAFDTRMTHYRKLIEDTEGYLVGAQQGSPITPKDVFICLKKLHETFIALAAQLQSIHEQVKEQKDQYLAYRKVFHNDETDVFEQRKKSVTNKSKLPRTSQPLGPTPFTGLSSYAVMMMNAAMNRQALQQTGNELGLAAPVASTQPPTTGLFGGTSTGFGGFGSSTTQPSTLFGAPAAAKPTFGFGSAATTSAPFGFSSGTAATKPAGFGFGTTTTSAPSFGFGSTAASKPTGFGFGAAPATTSSSLFSTPSTAAVKPLG